jgi:hypothetical protein
MDRHVGDYFQEFCDDGRPGLFHRVIALHQCPDTDWETIHAHAPALPRGWFELSRLDREDRVEFVRGYWLSNLPFQPQTHEAFADFFSRVDDIGVFVTQDLYESPPEVQMVYSLRGDRGFFRGGPGASEEEVAGLNEAFKGNIPPSDYTSFLQIHNGFGKYTDTGLSRLADLPRLYASFQEHLEERDPLIHSGREPVDTRGLFPFYESFGLHCYQCFWSEWYPEQEMGNVYYSGIDHWLADHRAKGAWSEKLAFPTFLDWLMFYLESVEV